MPKRHPRDTVNNALELLRRSAEQNDGQPNYSAISRQLGLSRKALRTWWANRPPGGGPMPPEPEPPPVNPESSAVTRQIKGSPVAVSLGLTDTECGYICAPRAGAASALGELRPGFRLEVVNRGQFSLIEVVRAILKQTGPANVTLSTWSAGIRDAANAAWLLETGEIRRLLMMVDRGMKTLETQKTYYQRLQDWYGEGSILQCRTHAKFAIIRNEGWHVVVRTSANLNENVRLEQFSIDDNRDMADFYESIVSSWAGCVPLGFAVTVNKVDRAFKSALVDVETDRPPLRLVQETDTPAAPARTPAPATVGTDGPGLYDLDPVAFIESQANEAQSLYTEAKRDRSYVAAGKMFDRMGELYEQLQAARQTAADASGLDEAAFLDRLEDEAADMPDPHLEVYVREYLQRHRLQLVDAAAG